LGEEEKLHAMEQTISEENSVSRLDSQISVRSFAMKKILKLLSLEEEKPSKDP
jgi:hypothetical protein